jgi:hypothetical protein
MENAFTLTYAQIEEILGFPIGHGQRKNVWVLQ